MVSLQKHLERVRGGILIANLPESGYLTDGIINDGDILELSSYVNMTDMEKSIWNKIYEHGYLSEFNDYKSSRDVDGNKYKFYKTVEVPYISSGTTFIMETEVEDLLHEGTLTMDDLSNVKVVTQRQYNYLVSVLKH